MALWKEEEEVCRVSVPWRSRVTEFFWTDMDFLHCRFDILAYYYCIIGVADYFYFIVCHSAPASFTSYSCDRIHFRWRPRDCSGRINLSRGRRLNSELATPLWKWKIRSSPRTCCAYLINGREWIGVSFNKVLTLLTVIARRVIKWNH